MELADRAERSGAAIKDWACEAKTLHVLERDTRLQAKRFLSLNLFLKMLH